ncbi:MAG: energy transducer TonB [Blastocatellia bacterium]|nr:energy transducer TonB [Blastocatellia bacterium]
MAAVTTSEFVKTGAPADAVPFTLIETKGLMARLGEEIARAASELSSDPRAFLLNLISSGAKDAKRRRRIYTGLACALVVHVALIAAIAFASLHYVKVNASPPPEVTWVQPDTLSANSPDTPRPEKLKGEGGGGGGGGDNDPQPASGGALPQMRPTPQIVHPLAPPAKLPDALVVPPTLIGPESPPVPANVQLGVPGEKMDAPPSPGSGSGGGMGDGKGTGVGGGGGPGAGDGSGGGRGDNKSAGLPDGTGSRLKPIDFRISQKPPGFTPIVWIYRPRPIVTPEAQANKIKGEVLLRATFHANGRITDIEVMRPIKYMTESAIESLQRSKFRPAAVKGEPVTVFNVYVKVRVGVGEIE